ncbi:ethanolamine utilization protein EutH [Candidatus Formimonas warabiya]|uniref:Ethanolamine utilization protein EutH n=1 Tax=Formimonas warabiya TaxID=1761012 RepID=A0A3G1KS96_FORW1|nr:ethanolamine utilization protein EutH [Candidatus Formimonas warabiya]ATW25331.1 ethanolamine utilization protein EutH [Candidatus Formimonas warabiya]
MAEIGNYVLYIIMACAVAGAFASIIKEESGLGKEFLEGLYSIGPIFVPVAGIMAATPYLAAFVKAVFGPVFSAIGADPAIAATTFIAVDMGGYQLADALAQTRESWIMAMVTGYMAGATIVFSIPVGLAMLEKKDHKYMALGVMSGILTVPIGVFVTSLILSLSNAHVREIISTDAQATYQLALSFGQIMANLVPLIVICVAIAVGLRFVPDTMIKGFMWFGKAMDTGIKIVLVFSIVEYFTGFFSTLLGSWGFNPIIADAEDQFRALEISGYIGVMLAGAFPMVYLIKKYLARPLEAVGRRFGFSSIGSAGILAAAANILALFRIIKDMPAADKVKCIAFAVCSAFLFGDHLAFTANFQPTMIVPVMTGKLTAGLTAVGLAIWLSVPKAIKLEKEEQANQ